MTATGTKPKNPCRRGNRLGPYMVQGAKSLIWAATGKAAEPNPCCRLRRWIRARHGSLHINTLAVAVANRIARAACAIMQSGRPYDPRHRELPA